MVECEAMNEFQREWPGQQNESVQRINKEEFSKQGKTRIGFKWKNKGNQSLVTVRESNKQRNSYALRTPKEQSTTGKLVRKKVKGEWGELPSVWGIYA